MDILHREHLTLTQRASAAHRARFRANIIARAETRTVVPPVFVDPPKPDVVETAPAKPYIVKRRFPSLDDISEIVCEQTGVTKLDLESGRRSREVTRPRQLWMYLVRNLTPTSFPAMGRYLGGRDHTTCLHGHRKIETLIKTDAELAATVQVIAAAIMQRFHERNPLESFDAFDCCDYREI
jgi:hypothetical protein